MTHGERGFVDPFRRMKVLEMVAKRLKGGGYESVSRHFFFNLCLALEYIGRARVQVFFRVSAFYVHLPMHR